MAARRWLLPIVFAAGLALHGLAVSRLDRLPRTSDPREIDAVLPRFVQVVMNAGDRYLAANLATFRALIAAPHRMSREEFQLLGRIHRDAAWFNPAHEDNYYVAANILPWAGEYAAAQAVLRVAQDGRPFDWLPVFYYAFDIWYFERQPLVAAKWLEKAIPRAREESDRIALETMAQRWAERGQDTRSAIRLLDAMSKDARHSALRTYYRTRRERLETLLVLEDAARRFREREGRSLASLDELVAAGFIAAVPQDPFGFGYVVDAAGNPLLLNRPRAK